jgi:hypothetical protein
LIEDGVATPLWNISPRFIVDYMEPLLPQSTPDQMQTYDAKPQFNVVIAYEDFATGRHAQETFDFLARNLEPELILDSQMWKFDVLGNAKLREMATRDAAEADLIMISTHGEGDLPPEVKGWVDEWIGRLCSAMALVKLTDRHLGGHPQDDVIRAYLQTVAHRAGMDFFAQPDEWPDRHEDFSLQQISERAHATSTLMARFLTQNTANWRWWSQ